MEELQMAKKKITGQNGKEYTVKEKKPFYKKIWFWLLILVVVFMFASVVGSDDDESTASDAKTGQKQSSSKKKDNVPAEYRAAQRKGQTYADTMNMSKAGIYDQLTSDAGEGFPQKAAQYAVDHIKVNYNKNALEKAKDYREEQDMSNDSIHEQLTSEAGEQFTSQEADYAIQHIDD
ncbi:prophage superinfection immunity protein [Ligilactobacillus acidipiscis DSM 15836]|uniref:Prophage superinfection immunity protein n=2 Tax=Ligilactobacillus acidipiscis TaxID=89059 RepID=A0ABR5PNG8_9LACO|nr:prophage superinfection immunity protein [Ligilactobacillus acidipiscis DSM 15836]